MADGSLLITASGVDKGTITADQVVRVWADGRPDTAEGASRAPGIPSLRVSSEVGMHRAIYAARPDVAAIVHAHPPAATGFAAAGMPLPVNALPEIPVVIGPVALVPYGRPGTPALAEAMHPFLANHDAFLLANHGVTTVGPSLTEALLRMESVEQAARIVAVARLLGGERSLPAEEVTALASHRRSREFP